MMMPAFDPMQMKANPAGLSLVIQAGGKARRMGQDKGLARLGGQPLVQRAVERLAAIADQVLVTTNNAEGYRFLGLPLAADILPGSGALGGLYTALSAAGCVAVAVVACDMPFASPGMLVYQHQLLLSTGADLVIPRHADKLEPFHAVYRRESCLPLVRAALEAGKRRVDAWFEQAGVHTLDPAEWLPFDPPGRAFLNINTREELAEAEKMIAQDESPACG